MTAAPFVTIDDSLWPIRIVRFVGVATLAQFEHYLAEMEACLRRGEKFVCVLDLTQGGAPTVEHRQRQVEWIHRNEPLMCQVELGVAFLVASPVMRLALSIIFYFKPMPIPYLVTTQSSQAIEWAAQRLADAGLAQDAERIRQHVGLPSRKGSDDNASHT